MFFCDFCAKKNSWPESTAKSHGPCEVCKRVRLCNDIPSRYLPSPPKTQEVK